MTSVKLLLLSPTCLQSDVHTDEMKRNQMERLVREELERWDSDSNIDGAGSANRSSPGVGARTRSANASQNVSFLSPCIGA